jgi:hypothetical protein
MTNMRTLAVGALAVALMTTKVEAQALSEYRNFELGSDVVSVSSQAGIASSEAKLIHQRPAVLQDLVWRPMPWLRGSSAPSTDPVEQIVFSFYNDRLFRIVVDYAHRKTEGMTAADMIEAISVTYGTPLPRTSRVAVRGSQLEGESGSRLARWGDAGHDVALYQTSSYGTAFRLIVTDARLEDLARKAETEATRLDAQEAPRREIARQKKERDDSRAAAEKARIENKEVFRP